MDIKQKVKSGLGWSAGAKFLGQMLTWSMTLIVMRLLTPGDYGLMAMASFFISFITMLSQLGLGAALIQRPELDERTLRQVSGLLLVINFGCFLLLFLVAPLIAKFFEEQRIIPVLRFLSLQFIIMSFSIIPQSLLDRNMDFRRRSTADFVSAIAGGLISLLLALNGFGVWSLVWGSLGVMVCRTVVLNFFSPFLKMPICSMRGIAQTISFGGLVTINRILWFFFAKADIFIIGKLLGQKLLGFYSVAMEMASLPMEKISPIMTQVALPAFSSIQANRQRAASHFLKAIRILSFISFPALWGISSISGELVAILLGDKWQQAAAPFQLLALVVPIRMIASIGTTAVTALGRPDICFFNGVLSAVAMSISILVGVHWKLIGVSLAWVIVFPLTFVCFLLQVRSVLEVSLKDVLTAVAKPALSAFIMYITVVMLKMFIQTNVKSIAALVCLVIDGILVYGVMILILDRHRYREALNFMRA